MDADPPIHRDVGRAITDPAKVPALFDDLARWNVSTVKIYAGTARPVGRAIIDEGHRRGLFVTAHLGNYSAQHAVADGIDCLEHIWSVFNYVIPPEVAKEPGHRGRLDLGNPLCESLVAELAKRKTYVDPTLAVFRNMILLTDVAEVRDHPDNALVPQRLRDFWPVYLRQTGCPQGGPLEDRRREFAKFQELTGKLYRAGVPLLVGTDSPEPQVPPGFSLHQELEMLVESGLSAGRRAACRDADERHGAGRERTARLDRGRQMGRHRARVRQSVGRHPQHPAYRTGDSRRQCLPPGGFAEAGAQGMTGRSRASQSLPSALGCVSLKTRRRAYSPRVCPPPRSALPKNDSRPHANPNRHAKIGTHQRTSTRPGH